MTTSVFVSGNTVWICAGGASSRKAKVKKLLCATLPQSETPDAEAFPTFLRKLWSDNKLPAKDVRLVLDADLCQTRNIPVPIVKEKNLLEIVKNEFLISGEVAAKDMLYDYTVLDAGDKRSGGLILGAALPRQTFRDSVEPFAKAGISIADADLSIASAVRVVNCIPALKGGSYILGVVSPHHLRLLLFINGGYLFSNTVALFEEQPEASAVEISRHISSMLQFNMAQKTDVEVKTAYICGMQDRSLELFESMSEYLGIRVNTLPGAPKAFRLSKPLAEARAELSDYLFALGGLLDE